MNQFSTFPRHLCWELTPTCPFGPYPPTFMLLPAASPGLDSPEQARLLSTLRPLSPPQGGRDVLCTDRAQLSRPLPRCLLQPRADFLLPLFGLCAIIVISVQSLTLCSKHDDCFSPWFWQPQHATVEGLSTVLSFCSHCSTNAKTQEGYCSLLGCFSRMKTLMLFRRKIQIHAVSCNCVTSQPSFSSVISPKH